MRITRHLFPKVPSSSQKDNSKSFEPNHSSNFKTQPSKVSNLILLETKQLLLKERIPINVEAPTSIRYTKYVIRVARRH